MATGFNDFFDKAAGEIEEAITIVQSLSAGSDMKLTAFLLSAEQALRAARDRAVELSEQSLADR